MLHRIPRFLCAAILVAATAIGASAALGKGGTPITAGTSKIVRGVNFTFVGGQAQLANGNVVTPADEIGKGNNPTVTAKEDLDNLSVSCSDDKSATVDALRANLPNPHIYWTTLGDLRNKRKEVTLVRDPTDDNPNHCLLGTITPKQFISGANYKP